MKTARFVPVLAGLTLFAPGTARSASLYQIRAIVKVGDKVGKPQIHLVTGLWVGALNDKGQIAFVSANAAGGPVLFRYADGSFTPIVYAGQDSPLGQWPALSVVWSPVSMNQAGSVAFSLLDQPAGAALGTFVWNPKTQQVTPIALKGKLRHFVIESHTKLVVPLPLA